jgi:hypothetical protein
MNKYLWAAILTAFAIAAFFLYVGDEPVAEVSLVKPVSLSTSDIVFVADESDDMGITDATPKEAPTGAGPKKMCGPVEAVKTLIGHMPFKPVKEIASSDKLSDGELHILFDAEGHQMTLLIAKDVACVVSIGTKFGPVASGD